MKQDKSTTKKIDRVPLKQKIGVGIGGFPFQNGTYAVQYMAQPIFQIFLGLSPMLMGLAMTIPRVLDAFTDPIMGTISDKYSSKWGRRRPFIFIGALMMAITYMMIWWVPRSFGEGALFTWLVVSSILFFLAYTVYSVPVTSLTYELTPDYRERTRVMAFWGFFFSAGNLAINWYSPLATNEKYFGARDAVTGVFQNGLLGDHLTGARIASVVAGVLIFGFMGIMPAILGRERFYKLAKKEQEEKVEKIGFLTAIKQLGSSKAMLVLITMILSLNFCATIAGSLAQYIVIYFVMSGDVVEGIQLNALNGTGFAIIGFAAIPVLTGIANKFGKKQAMFFVLFLALFGGAAKWFIFTPDAPYLLLLDAVLNGPVWVAIGVIIPSMLADLCDYDELQHGERREGMISAVYTWITKVGLSFTFLFSGFALTLSKFDEALLQQSPETLLSMRLWFVGASVAAALGALIILRFYPISEKVAIETREKLEVRRGKV
jgi:GPH family glycoside/pentoside/hexuronide:cation symporter